MSQNTNGYNNGGGYYSTNPTMGYGGLNTTQPTQMGGYSPQTGGPDTSYNLPSNATNLFNPAMNGVPNAPFTGPYNGPFAGYGTPTQFTTMPYPMPAPGNTGFFSPGGGFSPGTQPYMPPAPTPTSNAPFGGQRPSSYPAAPSGQGIGTFTGGLSPAGQPPAQTGTNYVNPNQTSQNTQGLSPLQVGLGMHYTPDGRLTF